MTANRPAGFEVRGECAGFVAAESSWCGELGAAARHSASTGAVLVVSSTDAVAEAKRMHTATGARTVIDTYFWHRGWASADAPTQLHQWQEALLPYEPGDWARDVLAESRAEAVYLPAFTVRAGEPEVLAVLVDYALRCVEYGLSPFFPLQVQALASRHIDATLAALAPVAGLHPTFQFNSDKAWGLADAQHILGLRELLSRFPGSDVIGLDIAGGLDALAHGARWVGIGAASSRRFPRIPDAKGGGAGDSAGFKPGTWLRPYMAMHSPDVYADWFANSLSPRCDTCVRPLDLFGASPSEKTAAIEHNLHGVRDIVTELMAQPVGQRQSWLHEERVGAFEAHAQLISPAAKVQADLMLRRLLEVDDPAGRRTTPNGAWQQI